MVAKAKQLAFHELRIAAHSAATAWENAAKELRRIGGNAARSIKTHAQETGGRCSSMPSSPGPTAPAQSAARLPSNPRRFPA